MSSHLTLCLFMVLGALAPSLARTATVDQPPGARVSVDGHLMHVYCTGHGRPTVVLDAGLGGFSLEWARVQPMVAEDTRVCSYDRAGYGWSEGSRYPRTSAVIAHELHRLLRKARIPGPYLLVGHSFGGLNMRSFAGLYPQDTAGLVLVDATHEQQFKRFEEAAGVVIAPRSGFVLGTPPPAPAALPPALRPLVEALSRQYSTLNALRGELGELRASAAQVARTPFNPRLPVVVISRGRRVWPDTPRGNLMEALWKDMQNDLAKRARAVHMVAEHSGHDVPLEQPDAVVDGICVALQEARSHNPPQTLPRGWLKQRCSHERWVEAR